MKLNWGPSLLSKIAIGKVANAVQLEHFGQGIRVYPNGIVGPEKNSWPPPEGPSRTFFNTGAAADTAVIGHILPPPGIFPDLNAYRAVIAADAALDAAAGVGGYLIESIFWRGIGVDVQRLVE